MSEKKGMLYGIGVGPGDPELMTLKAVRLVKECPVLGIPGRRLGDSLAYKIAGAVVSELDSKSIFMIEAPMTRDETRLTLAHERTAAIAMDYLDRGLDVAVLTLGDPTIYSTYIYIHRIIVEAGYQAHIISGVPSFCAAAAKSGDSLVDKDQQLHVLPACYGFEDGEGLSGTKVYMKAGGSFREFKNTMAKKQGFFIENCGMENEQCYNSISELPDKGSYFSLGIIK